MNNTLNNFLVTLSILLGVTLLSLAWSQAQNTTSIPTPTQDEVLKPITVRSVSTKGVVLEVPYQIEGEAERIVTIEKFNDCSLVNTRTTEGKVIAPNKVQFSSEGGQVIFVFNCEQEKEAPRFAHYKITREVLPELVLPGQTAEVKLIVENNGKAAGEYSISDILPARASLQIDNTQDFAWQEKLEAGQTNTHSYFVQATCTAPIEINWQGVFEPRRPGPGVTGQVITGKLELTQLTITMEEVSKAIKAERPFELTFNINNPSKNVAELTLNLSSTNLEVLESPNSINIPAEETATAKFKLVAKAEGVTNFKLTPSYENLVDCEEHSQEFTINIHPKAVLPPITVTASLSFDAFVENVIGAKGMAFLVRLPENVNYVPGSAILDEETIADPLQKDNFLVFELQKRTQGKIGFVVTHSDQLLITEADTALLALLPEPIEVVGFGPSANVTPPEGEEATKETIEQAESTETTAEIVAEEQVAKKFDAITIYQKADIVTITPEERKRVGAVILEPTAGLVIRSGNIVNISIDIPLSHQATLFVNNKVVPSEKLGQETANQNLARKTLDYIAVSLESGPNELKVESQGDDGETLVDSITVFLAGAPEKVTITPISELMADSANPLDFDIKVRDAWDNIPNDGFLTIELENAEPAGDDENAQQLGYQVRYLDGKALLKIAPLPLPDTITIIANLGNEEDSLRFKQNFVVGSDFRPWIANGVGSLGITYDINGKSSDDFHVGYEASFFARGTILENYQLTLAANYPDYPLGIYGDPYKTFAVTGSSGELSQDTPSRHGVFARIESNLSYLQYGDFDTSFEDSQFALTRGYTGLSGEYRLGSPAFIRGYVVNSVTGNERQEELESDGTSFYRLAVKPIAEGSLKVEVIKRNSFNGTLINTEVDDGKDVLLGKLEALKHYKVNEELGFITLNRQLPLTDLQGNPYSLKVHYQVVNEEDGQRDWRFGVQAGYDIKTTDFGVDNIAFRAGMYHEVLKNRGNVNVATVGATVQTKHLKASVEGAYGSDDDNSGLAAVADIDYSSENLQAAAHYDYTSKEFRSAESTGNNDGHNLDTQFSLMIIENLGFLHNASFSYRADKLTYDVDNSVNYQISNVDFAKDVGAEFGLQLENSATRILAGFGINEPFSVERARIKVLHRQALSASDNSITEFTVGYRVLGALELTLTDKLEWGVGNSVLVGFSTVQESSLFGVFAVEGTGEFTKQGDTDLGLSTSFSNAELLGAAANWGSTLIKANYSLPSGTSLTAGQANLGISTSYPITKEISLEAAYDQKSDFNNSDNNTYVLGAGARYDTEDANATFRYELRLAKELKQVASAGFNALVLEDLFLSSKLELISDESATPKEGLRFNVAAAYRGDAFDILTQHTFELGAYQKDGEDELNGDFRIVLPVHADFSSVFNTDFQAKFDVSLGYVYRYRESTGYQDMISLGGRLQAWEGGYIGAFGQLFHDWKQNEFAYGFTAEVSQRVFCGTYAVAGYSWNTLADPVFGHEGLQLRVDIAVDEQFNCSTPKEIYGLVFSDVNSNGIKDIDEQGIGRVLIRLYDQNNELVSTVHSKDNGSYHIYDLRRGVYTLVVTLPEGYAGFSPVKQGDNTNYDSDVNANGEAKDLDLEGSMQLDVGLLLQELP